MAQSVVASDQKLLVLIPYQGLNVAEVFWFARRLCIYPVAPLYDVSKGQLTEGCVRTTSNQTSCL